MGANLCSSFRHPRTREHCSATTLNSHDDHTIYDMIKQKWWKKEKTEMKRKKEESSSPQKQKMHKNLSLEELLLASPRLSSKPKPDFINGGQFHVSKNHSSKRKVHPSNLNIRSFPRSSSFGRLAVISEVTETEESQEISNNSIIRRNQSGKLKKKVSFKLPEESDFIVFHSPQDSSSSSSCDANVLVS